MRVAVGPEPVPGHWPLGKNTVHPGLGLGD